MNIYNWQILRVDNYPTLTDSTGTVFYDIIYAIQWQVTGTAPNGSTAWVYDSMGLTIDLSSSLIPRNELSEDNVLEWVRANLGETKIASLYSQLDEMLLAIP